MVVVQQNAHPGRTLSHMDVAHNATVEKCVSEMKRNGKLKTSDILMDHDKENHWEVTNVSVINFNAQQ